LVSNLFNWSGLLFGVGFDSELMLVWIWGFGWFSGFREMGNEWVG